MNRAEFIAGYRDYYLNIANDMNSSKQGIAWDAYVCEKEQLPLFNIITKGKAKPGSEAIEKEITKYYEILESPLYQALK